MNQALEIDRLIERSRFPRIPWPSRRSANRIARNTGELQDALDSARSGDVIALVGKDFWGGVKIRQPWANASPRDLTWAPPPRDQCVVALVNGNASGVRPRLHGIACQKMARGSELWLVDVALKPAEYWNDEKQQDESGASIIGSWEGLDCAIRGKDITFADADVATGYGGSGAKWGWRTDTFSFMWEDCASAPKTTVQEHYGYAVNPAFHAMKNCKLSGVGRTIVQVGTRAAVARPCGWLGVLYEGCEFEDAFCGSATPGNSTLFGYPGLTIYRNHKIKNLGRTITGDDGETVKLDPAAGLVVFQTFNYGGNILDPSSFCATHTLVLDNVQVEVGEGQLDAVLLESTRYAHVRNLDISASAPGARVVNIPGIYGASGVQDLYLYGEETVQKLLGLVRSRQGAPGTKKWQVWTEQELRELIVATPR